MMARNTREESLTTSSSTKREVRSLPSRNVSERKSIRDSAHMKQLKDLQKQLSIMIPDGVANSNNGATTPTTVTSASTAPTIHERHTIDGSFGATAPSTVTSASTAPTIHERNTLPASDVDGENREDQKKTGLRFRKHESFIDPIKIKEEKSDVESLIESWWNNTENASSTKPSGPILKHATISTISDTADSASRTSSTLPNLMASIFNPIRKGRKLPRYEFKLPSYEFLVKDNHEEGEESGPKKNWWHCVFIFSVIGLIACIVTLWAPYPIGARMPSDQVAEMPWSDGCQGVDSCICPRETICADDVFSMVLLTVARCSAWFDYPLYMLLFLSKAHNLNNFLQTTMLRIFIDFAEYHKVHSIFGIVVGIESTCHSLFHILRWARRKNDIQLLWTSKTGITGLTVLICCPLIVLPMSIPYLKQKMSFEWRKGLHYLSIVWGVALLNHAPQRIFWLIGVPFFIYLGDVLLGAIAKTHLLESALFERLSDSACLISFENPPTFGKQNAAYAYLVLPWLSKYQFHAFTVFPALDQPNHSSICISKAGSWTTALMNQITTPAHRTAYIVGPFLSPFSSPAMDKENLLVVASGIGVTPAISLIQKYSVTLRRVNLVWICRDPGLVEHFVENVEFGHYGYQLIYYTGKDRLLVLGQDLPPNVFIFTGRPNLEQTLSAIIYSIVSGDGLPEELCTDRSIIIKTPPEVRSKLLIEKALSLYSMDQLYEYAIEATFAYFITSGEKDLRDAPSIRRSIVLGINEENDLLSSQRSSMRNFSESTIHEQQTKAKPQLRASFGFEVDNESDDDYELESLAQSPAKTDSSDHKEAGPRMRFGKSLSDGKPAIGRHRSNRRLSLQGTRSVELGTSSRLLGRLSSMPLAVGLGTSNRALGRRFSMPLSEPSSKIGCPAETVNYQGLCSIMQQLLGDDYQLVEKKLHRNFEKVVVTSDIDRNKFGDLMQLMVEDEKDDKEELSMSLIRSAVERRNVSMRLFDSGHGSSLPEDEFEIKGLLKGDGQFSAKRWSMLYCGGSQPVIDQLKAYKCKFGISLSIEKFDW